MTIDCVYYNDFIRCFRNGRVERINRQRPKNGWYEVENKIGEDGYLRIRINRQNVLRHRLIAFCFCSLENIVCEKNQSNSVDHKNHIKTDNSVNNLRVVTHSENHQNRKNVKGYYKKNNKYLAQIGIDKKMIKLGKFDTEIEARNAYLKAKEKYHII